MEIGKLVDELTIHRGKLDQKRREIADAANNVKQQLRTSFDTMRKLMEQKERELTLQIDSHYDRELEKVGEIARLTESRTTAAHKVSEIVKTAVEMREECKLLEF